MAVTVPASQLPFLRCTFNADHLEGQCAFDEDDLAVGLVGNALGFMSSDSTRSQPGAGCRQEVFRERVWERLREPLRQRWLQSWPGLSQAVWWVQKVVDHRHAQVAAGLGVGIGHGG